jgi:hypothetical protein
MLALAAKAMAWVSSDAIESCESRVGGVGEVGGVDRVCMGRMLGLSIRELAIIDFRELANSSQSASAILNLA